MSLQVWLPMTKDLRQQGLSDVEVTNNGAVFNSAGKLGGCYNFGTGASSLSLPKSFFTSFTGDFSIACWVKIITWNSSYATIWAATSTSASWQNIMAGLFRYGSQSKILFCIGNDSSSTQSNCITTEDIQLNTWYHFVCTYTSGKIRLYQNGELVSSYNTSIVPKFSSTQYFNIGKMRENTYQTNSSINDFRFYDHCLSSMEVKQISQGLVLHYPLNDKYIESTSNIITSLKAGGRTNVINGDKIQNTGENADTYFYLMSPGLVAGETYTLSYYCNGLSSSSPDWKFGVGAQSATSADHCGYISIQNGWNYLTFICPNSLNGNTQLILDDYAATWRTSIVTFSSFQLEHNNYKTGIQPINTWCGAKLTADTIIGSNGAISSSGGWYTTDYISIIPNKSYKLTGLSKGGSGTYVALFDSSKTLQRTLLITANQDVSFTASANEYFLRTSIRNLAYELTTTAKLIYLDSIEYDTSGYCNNGIRTGAFTWSDDTPKYNVSQQYNGNTYIVLPITCSFSKDAVSVSVWGYESNWNVSTAERLVGAATNSSGWCIGDYGSENTLFAFYANGSFNVASGFKSLTPGWHHFVISFDGLNLIYYVDGQEYSKKVFSSKQSVTGNYNINMGRHYGGGYSFKGKMSDLRIYATALSADDVRALYENSAYIDNSGNTYAATYTEV